MKCLYIRQSDSQTLYGGAMPSELSKVGKRGAVVIPASLRRRFGITEGSLVIAEGRAEGVLIRQIGRASCRERV